MTDTFTVRSAVPSDARAVSLLMYEAIGDIAHTIAGTTDLPDTLDVLEELFELPGCRLSYDNALVCEDQDGGIAGFVLSYPGEQAAALDIPLIRRLEERGLPTDGLIPETNPGEYYLDSVAVSGAYRGAGLGTRLIQAFEQRAADLGQSQAMLLVESENTKARALYKRLGYHPDGWLDLSGHQYQRMIKPIDPQA